MILGTENARSKEPEKLIGRNITEFITCPKTINEFNIKVRNALHKNTISVHFDVVVKYDGKREKRRCHITKSTDDSTTALVNFYSCEDLN